MNTQEIADRLVALCRKADYETAQKELYSTNILSVEPGMNPNVAKETRGLEAILEKGRKFKSMIEEVFANEVSEPLVVGSTFACMMRLDVKMKGEGRMDMKELCVYEVKDGKVVREQFYM